MTKINLKSKNDFLVVIPARMGSTRFPGKVLAELGGRPMVEWCRQAALAAAIGPVLVATEDKAAADALRLLGTDVVMTSTQCPSGTDRVWEAAQKRLTPKIKFIMNLQGDEPLIAPETIRKVAETLRSHPRCDIATAVVPADERDAENPNAVKIALAADGRCLYFSRAQIPYPRRPAIPLTPALPSNSSSMGPGERCNSLRLVSHKGRGNHGIDSRPTGFFKHIGIYAFRRKSLARFVRLPPSPLEQRESLEQLRALEAGMTIYAAVVQSPAIAIDTPEDLERARRIVAQNQKELQGPCERSNTLRTVPSNYSSKGAPTNG